MAKQKIKEQPFEFSMEEVLDTIRGVVRGGTPVATDDTDILQLTENDLIEETPAASRNISVVTPQHTRKPVATEHKTSVANSVLNTIDAALSGKQTAPLKASVNANNCDFSFSGKEAGTPAKPDSSASLKALVENASQRSRQTSSAPRSGSTLEELVIEALRPQLKEWLDKHLDTIVKQLVEKEIRRLSSSGNPT